MANDGRSASSRSAPRLTAGLCAIALLSASMARATDNESIALPIFRQAPDSDDRGYSYYFVPRLSELNQMLGAIFRTGRVQVASADGSPAVVRRYAAFSCEGTLMLASAKAVDGTENVDWAAVTGLHPIAQSGRPALVVERMGRGGMAAQPLVLQVSDSATRYQLQEALAVLITACRPRSASPASKAAARPAS